jgi:XTP/dITP diphosphohydrolase
MKTLRIATQNQHKLREFREMLEPLGYRVLGLEGITGFDVVEDGETFAANAVKKAQALEHLLGETAVADDSGLVVDALGGAPGVHSARYAGVEGPQQDAANRRKLLVQLAEVDNPRRTARFVCALAWIEPGRTPVVVEGRCEGTIGRVERGAGGFGYDSLFIPQGQAKTMAELPASEKHKQSHRGRALAAWLDVLRRDNR